MHAGLKFVAELHGANAVILFCANEVSFPEEVVRRRNNTQYV
jgi:hypothetical protein